MIALTTNTTVGDIVKDRPSRSRVFEHHQIDYCCGGKLPLAEACSKRGVDVQHVLDALQQADAQTQLHDERLVNADAMTLTALADHIEQTHHAYLREELPRLGGMVRKVAAVHGERFPWTVELAHVFAALSEELSAHMLKEEQILFPAIRAVESGRSPDGCCAQGIGSPITMMEHEHDDAGAALERMNQLSSSYTPPADACNTFRAMLDGLAQLEADMHQHVHKENNVLFPKALELEARN